MRAHLGVLAFDKLDSGVEENKKIGISSTVAIPARPEESVLKFTEPLEPTTAPLRTLHLRTLLRHTSIIIAIPLFTFVMAALYARGLFKSNEAPGSWLLIARQAADQDWCLHCIVMLFFFSALLMVGKRLAYGLYVLSVAWSVLFVRSL